MFLCATPRVVGSAQCLLSKNADVVCAPALSLSLSLSPSKQIGFRVPYGFLGIACITKNK